jgi:hypothetical protein
MISEVELDHVRLINSNKNLIPENLLNLQIIT